ncbi:MAG: MFS transporter [Candidatus Saccharibacteria bacterium]|nr:MFS transporter [Candidatus Saccharibacteria bacterium]
MTRIHKLYISNLLTGLVFWYGIEKLFMQSIGIDAFGVGIVTAVILVFTLLFDLPMGLVADKWSRKGQLVISAVSLGACSFILGMSNSLTVYIIGVLFYGLYLVNTSGTYQAITYDILHEEGRAKDYTREMGRAYALFLVGAGLANTASGFIANIDIRLPFWLSLVPPILNSVIVLSIKEPTFHKEQQEAQFFRQFAVAVREVSKVAVVRSLILVSVGFGMIATFTLDLSQLYMLTFTTSPVQLGLLWAVFAFALAAGSYAAHHVKAHLTPVIIAAMCLMISFSLTRQSWGLIVFMIYAVCNTGAALLIETQVQHNTASSIRASVLSLLSTLSRLASLPTALVLGWVARRYDIFASIKLVSAVASAVLIYWVAVGSGRMKSHERLLGKE